MAIFVYQPWNNSIAAYSGKEDYQRRYCPTAWNFWLDAANTAKYAVELWSVAREAGKKEGFREAVAEARRFTESARAIAALAQAEQGYEPAKARDPKKEFLEYSKKFHL